MNQNADDNIIDFEFFESHREKLKPFGNETKYSSKIITKAVIETNPKEIQNNMLLKPLNLNNNIRLNNENSVPRMNYDCDSSPTSSEEKKLLGNEMEDVDTALFNCLAFNEDVDDRQIFNVEDKYMSDNSLSDSTITTVSSDFTSVSHLSSGSDSSCGSDLSSDSTPSKKAESKYSENVDMCHDNNTGDIDIELSQNLSDEVDERKSCESTIYQTNPNSESATPECNYKYGTNDYTNDDTNPDIIINESDGEGKSRNCDNINEDNNCEVVYEEKESFENKEECHCPHIARKGSSSTEDLEEKLGNISLATQSSSSNSSIAKTHNYWRGQNRFRSKRKELNLTFSREELIRIERDNTILLKKIMSYSKPRSVLLNHAFSHKKTSAAINRARQQKKIEQDNYILYSKISAMNRMKKVF